VNETAVEAIILAINALGCGILLFVSGVTQRIMNDMEPLEFKKFMNSLGRAAMSDPFAVTIATIPLFAIVYYFVAFGFTHWWFTAGIAIWTLGASITKITNLPIYTWVGQPENTDPKELINKRRRLALGNASRVWVTLLSIILMACQFSIKGTVIAVAACAIITSPSLWLARKYIPN
jgi:hypothetical protein